MIGLVAGALWSCGSAKDPQAMNLFTPMALDEHVVWFDSEGEQALFLDVGRSQPKPDVTRVALKAKPMLVVRRNASNEILSLVVDEDADTTELVAVDPKGVSRRYDLGTRFDAITQSDDGRYAIVHYQPGGASDESTFLFSPNEIVIVDLEKKGDEALTKHTLRSFGSGPTAFSFAPEMELAGERRRLAAVIYQSQLALLDLNHPERPEFTIELSRSSNIQIAQLRFSPEEQKIYALAAGSNDVYVIRLLPASGGRVNDFEPSVNQLGADATPRDMVPYEAGGEKRLLVVSGNSAQVVEASSSRVTQIPLDVYADHVLLFEGTSPFDTDVEPRALLYAANQSGVSFLDLVDVEERTTRNLEVVNVPGGISDLVRLNGNLVFAIQATSGVNVVNLEERTASPIQARVSVGAVVPSLETKRLWVAPEGGSALGYVDLTTLHPQQVNLDRSIDKLLVFNQTKPPRVVVTHDVSEGAVTILGAEAPTDTKQSVTLDGFFFAGALDR
ncbi:MAG TPA: hypothetical protein VHM70_12075 [Polyangiaceae bacterium]|nr:hypothetical protein [Polyangiaceae bacterium]